MGLKLLAFWALILTLCGQVNALTQPAPKKQSTEKALLQIYNTHRQTFFCEESFSTKGHTHKEQTKIKWMSLVSSKEYAKNLLCYQEKICINKNGETFKGLRCCDQQDPVYQRMKKDLHNLVPELPLLKKQRGNHHFGLCLESGEIIKGCQIKLDKKNKTIEPSEALRGMIARTYLYMAQTYPFTLDEKEKALYLAWHQAYPPTPWERERNRRIKEVQGNGNPYIY